MRRIFLSSLIVTVLVITLAVNITDACRLASGGISGAEGDINMDGKVDSTDLSLLGQAWGSHLGDPNFNGCADFNHDHVVDLKDLAILGQHWGEQRFWTKVINGVIAEMKGRWYIAQEGNRVMVDAEYIGGGCVFPGPCLDRLRVVSPGDEIEDAVRYSNDAFAVGEEQRSPRWLDWWISGTGAESWLITIKDNGDHNVKFQVSTRGRYVAGQEIEVKW